MYVIALNRSHALSTEPETRVRHHTDFRRFVERRSRRSTSSGRSFGALGDRGAMEALPSVEKGWFHLPRGPAKLHVRHSASWDRDGSSPRGRPPLAPSAGPADRLERARRGGGGRGGFPVGCVTTRSVVR
jgi:hypothetical protein